MLPKRVGRYEVLRELATGGMAEILLACLRGPQQFERLVVVKRILPHLARQPQFVQMFVDEARSLARIAHPNVVQVSEFGHDDGELFLAMEYVAGENLASLTSKLADRGEELDPALAAFIAAEACAGLHAAHELKAQDGKPLSIVHRDISPQNVLIAYDGHVKVVDFGIALSADRITRTDTGSLKGKLEYMSPEQVRGAPLDRRSDVFSIGIVLHELVTGRSLYSRDGHAQVVEAICHEPPVPPSRVVEGCPSRLDEICARALEKAADDRYPTAAAMRKDLLEVARDIGDPTEALAALMSRIFAERIVEKSRLSARALAGDMPEVTRVIPASPPSPPEPPTLVPTLASNEPAPARRSRSWIPLATSIAVLGALILASLAALRVGRTRKDASASPAPVAAPVAARENDAHAADAGAAAGIIVSIKTVPPGARVLVDDQWKGDTPAEVALVRSGAPARIQIDHPGFQPVSQTILLDRDQTLFVSLSPAPRTRATRPPPRSTTSPRPSSTFWRFE